MAPLLTVAQRKALEGEPSTGQQIARLWELWERRHLGAKLRRRPPTE